MARARRLFCKLKLFILFFLSIILIYNLLNYKLRITYEQSQKCPLCDTLAQVFSVFSRASIAIRPAQTSSNNKQNDIEKIVISFVVCDSRLNESLNVVKSVLIFTKTPVHFVIFTEEILQPQFAGVLNEWRDVTDGQLSYELHLINFPKAHREDWINLFKKCASQRLFIPELITHIDAIIYVDIDTVFLGPVDQLWARFSRFNSSQITALALEHESPNLSWYPRSAKHPFYGKTGVNSGVMLMNLTRMRKFGWADYITPVMLKWKLDIPWGDQDIINIILHHHESRVLELSCRYNYRSDQCMYGDACHDASTRGALLLHGSRLAFHNHKQPAFEAVYKATKEYEVGTDPSETFLPNLEKYFAAAPESNCGNLKTAFLKMPTETLQKSKSFIPPDR